VCDIERTAPYFQKLEISVVISEKDVFPPASTLGDGCGITANTVLLNPGLTLLQSNPKNKV
jgi:hypothetical protein